MKRFSKVTSLILTLALFFTCAFPVNAWDSQSGNMASTGYQLGTYSEEEILAKITESRIANVDPKTASTNSSSTISAGGTIKAKSMYLSAGQTVTVRVTRNSAGTLLFFYLMNSSGDMVGPKTLNTDENLFVMPTGYTSMAPGSSGNWSLYIYNDGTASTSLTYYVS